MFINNGRTSNGIGNTTVLRMMASDMFLCAAAMTLQTVSMDLGSSAARPPKAR